MTIHDHLVPSLRMCDAYLYSSIYIYSKNLCEVKCRDTSWNLFVKIFAVHCAIERSVKA